MAHQRVDRKWRVVLLLAGVAFLCIVQVLLNYTWIGADDSDDLGETETFLVPDSGTGSSQEDAVVTEEGPPDVVEEEAEEEEEEGLPIEEEEEATARFHQTSPVNENDVRHSISQYLASGKVVRGRPSSHCAAYVTRKRGEDGKLSSGVRVALIRRQGWWSHQRSWSGNDLENLELFAIQDREVVPKGVTVTRQEVKKEDFSVTKGTNWYFPWPIEVGHAVETKIEFANGAAQDTRVEITKKMSLGVAGFSFEDCFQVEEKGEDVLPEGERVSVHYEYVFCRDAGRISVVSFDSDGKILEDENLLWSTAEAFQPWTPEALETCVHLQSFE
jgi:hypothetical protein